MTNSKSLYDFPDAYDLAFSYRDYGAEVEFILSLFKNLPSTCLELAAGPARHSLALAKKGVKVDGLDLSIEMMAYAQKVFALKKLNMNYYHQNMIDFSIPKKYDLIINMVDSISHIGGLRDLEKHLSSVANHLNKGGLYVVEAAHPKTLVEEQTTVNEWETHNDDMKVTFKWTELEKPQWHQQSYQSQVSMKIEKNGEVFIVSDLFTTRVHKLEDFLNAIDSKKINLELNAVYGDFSQRALEDEKAWRMILVFRGI